MSENLPEVQNADLAIARGQAALFEDSDQLLALTDAELRNVAAIYGAQTQGGLAQMRRNMGLLAWAGWLRFEGRPYEQFVIALSKYADVSPRTIKAWRDAVIQKDTLAVPPATDQRREEAKAREEKGRSKRVRAEKQHGKIIPATSKPVEESEGVAKDSPAPTPPPPAPPSAGGDSVVGADAPPAGPIEHEWSPVTPQTVEVMRETMQVQRLNGDVHSNVFAAMVEHLLADRERPVDDADGLRWLSSKTEQEWRALGDPYGPGIRAKIKFAATAFGFVPSKPERRQGTITRPQAAVLAGRAVTAPRDLTRRDVAPMFKKGS